MQHCSFRSRARVLKWCVCVRSTRPSQVAPLCWCVKSQRPDKQRGEGGGEGVLPALFPHGVKTKSCKRGDGAAPPRPPRPSPPKPQPQEAAFKFLQPMASLVSEGARRRQRLGNQCGHCKCNFMSVVCAAAHKAAAPFVTRRRRANCKQMSRR